MPKLIRTSSSDTFLVEAGDAQWRFPCILFPGFAAMFSVLRNRDCFDDCVERVCRRLVNSSVSEDDLFFAIYSDNNIGCSRYSMIFRKSDMISRSCKAGIRFIVRCPAS